MDTGQKDNIEVKKFINEHGYTVRQIIVNGKEEPFPLVSCYFVNITPAGIAVSSISCDADQPIEYIKQHGYPTREEAEEVMRRVIINDTTLEEYQQNIAELLKIREGK
jgi:hypothetical protein